MSKKQGLLLAALSFLLALIGTAMFFMVTNNSGQQRSFTQLLPVSRTKPQPTASLSLVPNPLAASSSAGITVSVVINTENAEALPHLIQLEIGYDPAALLEPEVAPGDFLNNPRVLLSTVNQNTGRISYALESDAGRTVKQTGVVAVLTFFPNPYATQQETQLTFLPKTLIKGDDGINILKQTHGATVIVK